MGSETSKQESPEYQKLKRQKELEQSQEELFIACRRVEDIIHNFRARAGTDVVCAQLHKTWMEHLDKIKAAWSELTLPARRAMVQNIRELVLVRARILHYVVNPTKGQSQREKTRCVEQLMEKICTELYDIDVLYKGHNLLDLVGHILEHGGDGDECPPMLTAEIFHGFDLEQDLKRRNNMQRMNKIKSANDLRKSFQRQSSSHIVVNLLSFLPQQMEVDSRKALTVKLVTEMRNAFLAHFAILVFGELIDDLDKVVYKYEYGSDSDTDVATSETEWDDSEEDVAVINNNENENQHKSNTNTPADDDDDLWLLKTQKRRTSA